MTLRPEDFVVTWHEDLETEKPATYTEIIMAMERLNERARKAKPGSIVEITLRRPVAIKVAQGINQQAPGTAVIDVGQEPLFVPEKGGYQSRLSVAQNATVMANYIDNY